MALRVFSIAGEALHFGARRMETTLRIGWLPILLLFIAQVTTLYALVSLQTGRLVTFADGAIEFDRVTRVVRMTGLVASSMKALSTAALTGHLGALGPNVWAVLTASCLVQLFLVATIVAPLTRLAGLGEEPERGLARFSHTGDDLRFVAVALGGVLALGALVFAPLVVASYYTLKSVVDAYARVYALFPNPESLHTVVEETGRQLIQEQGRAWSFIRGRPLLALAPVGALLWGVLFWHFASVRGFAGGVMKNAGRLLGTLIGGGAVTLLVWQWVLLMRGARPESEISLFLGFEALTIVLLYYFSLRLLPVAGVVLCRRSFRSSSFLTTTRGWNLLRLFGVLIVITSVVAMMQFFMQGTGNIGAGGSLFGQIIEQGVGFWALQSVFVYCYAALDSLTGWTTGGEEVKWLAPMFIWVWALIKIAYNFFWVLFSYGVLSGLLGRLYREYAAPPGGYATDAAVWMKKAG